MSDGSRQYRLSSGSLSIQITLRIAAILGGGRRYQNQVGNRSGTGITTIDNFTLLRAGKLLAASWESLWNFECNSTNRQPTDLIFRDNNTDNKPKVSAVELASYRSWFLRYQRRNAAECLMDYWEDFSVNDGEFGHFRRGFRC